MSFRTKFDIDVFTKRLEKVNKKYGDEKISIYYLDGIRYINKPNILITENVQPMVNKIDKFSMEKVSKILEQLGLSQADIGRENGASRAAVNNYFSRDFRGSTAIQIRSSLYNLCEVRTEGKFYLSMTIDELFL